MPWIKENRIYLQKNRKYKKELLRNSLCQRRRSECAMVFLFLLL